MVETRLPTMDSTPFTKNPRYGSDETENSREGNKSLDGENYLHDKVFYLCFPFCF